MSTDAQKAGNSRTSMRVFILLWIFWISVLLLVQTSFLKSSIQTYISHPVDFILRNRLEQTPPLSPKLKIFALDDQSVAFLGDNEIGLKDFVLLVENIARKKPKVIILDRLFGETPKGPEADYWLDRLAKIDVPIYSGSYFNYRSIAYRQELNLETDQYRFSKYPGGAEHDPKKFKFQKQSGIAYGYASAYEGAFNGVGHIKQNDDGTFFPMVLYRKDYLVPYLGLYAGHDLKLMDGELYVNGHEVPMTRKGASIINHRPVIDYYRISKSMRSMIKRARNGDAEKNVSEGDVVVVLFNFYTGSTAFFEGAPFGEIPAGFLVATVADSAIQGTWLKTFDHDDVLVVILCLLGLFLGLKSGPIQFWGLSLLFASLYFIISVYLFCYHSIVVAWFLPIVGFLGSGLIFYVHERLGSEFIKVQIEKDYYSEKSLRLEQENKKIKLEERLNLGKAVQEILLPDKMRMNFQAYTIGMKYESAQEMSGDWLYVWHVNPNEERIILGDVVGKGPSAAIPVAVIIGILGECEKLDLSLEDALGRINQRLAILFNQQITTTCAAVALRDSGDVTFYNAGSPGWFLIKASGAQYLPLRSSSLGLSLNHKIVSQRLQIDETTHAFTFTDGYMEGSRAFKRLFRYLEGKQELDVDGIHQALDEIGQDFRLEDDRSLLAVKVS
ncbi:PP2C family protein-serine/threonine phosphatase [Pseudobacteriovorax antillogorgiicola]|uniref:Serine phosphatase RsbU, regulator of sigma subunit n=1 Tax=Pseudobacteriovorax antillogorgiicola TaxID=1513793 RepID=A0A1Y6CL04_9BACT|nr:SpoIIE family protein phosphatase [Pseudobacteriovorax antillogorgiicola]TCS45632.1 serine phosphatase RsbU (regulator of sigma subunit) [Pseudobacteriovorax antillogorgiicola]SMF72643.1 Serine phosphatase RsbU, regulator of sigma subunit [Pseudobacteriovorax antillogorgiicola]